MAVKPTLKIDSLGRWWWRFSWVTGYIDIPHSRGVITVYVGPYETGAEAFCSSIRFLR